MESANLALPVRLAVGFRSPAINEAMSCRLGLEAQLQVTVAGESQQQMYQHVLERRPDVLLAQLETEDGHVLLLAERLLAEHLPTKLVCWSDKYADGVLHHLLHHGVRGFVLASEPSRRLVQSILQVARGGDFAISSAVEDKLDRNPEGNPPFLVRRKSKLANLSSKQFEILEHLAAGGTVKEVARELGLTEKSVESHKYRLMKILEVRDRLELMKFAICEGIVSC